MTVIAIIILLIVIWMIFGERISAGIRTFMAHRAEDTVRRMMGMPTRKQERKARRQAEKQAAGRSSAYRAQNGSSAKSEHIIPPEYAEDVEYVEVRDYSRTDTVIKDEKGDTIYHETQVEEAVIIEERNDFIHK